MKIITVVGTRPEIIRLSLIIEKFDHYFDHTLIHTGQNYDYELNEVFFNELNIRKPDYFLDSAGKTGSETIGKVIINSEKYFKKIDPDAILILGDTNSSLAAIPAKRNKIPIFHMEAGNRSFDYRIPEEVNRKIVDHISDINLPYSEISREYLINEGFPPDQIIVTGSPLREVLNNYKKQIEKSNILSDLKLQKKKYFIASIHREQNVDQEENLKKIVNLFQLIEEKYNYPIILSTHPRTKSRLKKFNIQEIKNILFHKPFGFFDYVKLQLNSKAVLSDSGSLTEESSILGFPALNIRERHERPEGFKEASVMLTGLDANKVLEGIEIIDKEEKLNEIRFNIVNDYETLNVSNKLVRIIFSYFSFVNQKVWKK